MILFNVYYEDSSFAWFVAEDEVTVARARESIQQQGTPRLVTFAAVEPTAAEIEEAKAHNRFIHHTH